MVELSTAGTSFSPAPVGGRRRRSHKVHHHRKTAKKVSARTIRKTLRKLGMRPKGRVVLKGGAEGEAEAVAPEMKAGRRGKKTVKLSMSMPRGLKSLSLPKLLR